MSFLNKAEPLTVWGNAKEVKDLQVLNTKSTIELQGFLAMSAVEESNQLSLEAEMLEASFYDDNIVDDKYSDSLFILTDALIFMYSQELVNRRVWSRKKAHEDLFTYKNNLDSWRVKHLPKALLYSFRNNDTAVAIQNKIIKVIR